MTFIEALQQIVPPHQFYDRQALSQTAVSYWESEPTTARCKVCPSSTEQVSQILKLCHHYGQAVVTQGGLTGCVQGAKATAEEVILSLEKLNQIEHIDTNAGTVTTQAGVILEALQQAVAEKQWLYPVDLGARGSCTIGGNIATNAGGINVLRYGMTRDQVLGLEVVMADGTIMNLQNHMLKNNSGYDLKQLFIGSEGTLGVVTKAVLKLSPIQDKHHTALVAANDFAAVIDLLKRAKAELQGSLSAYEVMWGVYYDQQTQPKGHKPILASGYPYYVLLETSHHNASNADAQFEALLADCYEQKTIVDAAIAHSEQQRRAMWDIRENFEPITGHHEIFTYDISLPIGNMAQYISSLTQTLKSNAPQAKLYTFGHIADGNLHLFINPGQTQAQRSEFDDWVYQPLAALSGAISAEHGIGTEKMAALAHYCDPAALALMKTLKQTIDPKGILNPARVLCPNVTD